MAGKFNALQQQLEQAAGRKTAVAPVPKPANESAPAKAVRKAAVKAPSKDVHIGAYLPPGFKTSMMLVRAQTGEDSKTLLAKALNEVFRAHNVPVVDLD